MRAYLMIAAACVAADAFAGEDPDVRPERTEVSAAPDRGEDGAPTSDRVAREAAASHNTTRSDRPGLKRAPAADGSHNASRSNRSRASSAAPAQDYNSSRSNNGSAGVALGDDDDDGDGFGDSFGDGLADASRAQNHNSSRSNRRTQPACRAGADDDCDDADRVPSPAERNKSRSNR